MEKEMESLSDHQLKQSQYLYTYYPVLFHAIYYHKTHKNENITFQDYYYLKQIYLDKNPYIVIKKATQSGISEWLAVTSLIKSKEGRGVFYVMPTDRLASRFVKNRIDRTINFTPYYKALVPSEKRSRFAESTSLKHIGKGSIAFVGSNTPTVFTEYPADDIIIDELDQCHQDNIKMAVERLSASKDPRQIRISNPTIEGHAIDLEFKDSTQNKWFIKCSNCGKYIHPDFFQHVIKDVGDNNFLVRDKSWDRTSEEDIMPICNHCHKPYDRFAKGQWVSQNKSNRSGYHISKMFSTNITVVDLLERFEKGLMNDKSMERFYNGDLGLAYISKGSKIDFEMLDECVEKYLMPNKCKEPCVCGIDVGNDLHVRIDQIMPNGKLKAMYIGTVKDYWEVMHLFKRYKILAGCIDALPEKRLSRKICSLHKRMFMVYYSDSAKKDTLDVKRKIVNVDRTASLDSVKENIMTKVQILPRNAKQIAPLTKDGISEYYAQMCASTRVFDENKQRYYWTEGSKKDHFMHAENYKLIARKLLKAMK
jgi:hypothetical protein